MKKNEVIELKIDSLAFGGTSIGRTDGAVCFVKFGVPGDLTEVTITKKKKKHLEAILNKVIEPSEHRINPPCQYFGNCGGCSWQNIEYSEQLKQKKQIVLDSIIRIGKLEVEKIDEAIHSPKIFNYRNKMEFSFSASRWLTKEEINSESELKSRTFGFGLHAPGRFDKVLDIDKCLLQNDRANELYSILKTKCEISEVTPYNFIDHTGFLKNFILRTSLANSEVLAVLITNKIANKEEEDFINWYKEEFSKNFLEQDSLIWAINDTNSPVNITESHLLHGKGYIIESILGIKYKVSPFSFFQTNSSHLDGFISKILELSGIEKNDIVWDLYCGAGSITLPASKICKDIYGIELVRSAIDDAKSNAERNNIKNTHFYCEDLHSKTIPELLNTLPKPDVLIIDPPRAGMHKNLLSHINELEPKKILYVSCNPTTQARDIEFLKDKYKISELVPVDMFPHTYHVESICRLDLK
jgi:23S rRNA (uracil1939-C5)-methyltransferase